MKVAEAIKINDSYVTQVFSYLGTGHTFQGAHAHISTCIAENNQADLQVVGLLFRDKTHWQGSLRRNAIVAQYHHQISQNCVNGHTNAQEKRSRLVPVRRPQDFLHCSLKKRISHQSIPKIWKFQFYLPAHIHFCHWPAPLCEHPQMLRMTLGQYDVNFSSWN